MTRSVCLSFFRVFVGRRPGALDETGSRLHLTTMTARSSRGGSVALARPGSATKTVALERLT